MGDQRSAEAVLLLVDETTEQAVLAARDVASQGVLPIRDLPEAEQRDAFILAMGVRPEGFDLSAARYHRVCIVASASNRQRILRFVAAVFRPVVEAGLLYSCDPPYAPERAQQISVAAADAATGEHA